MNAKIIAMEKKLRLQTGVFILDNEPARQRNGRRFRARFVRSGEVILPAAVITILPQAVQDAVEKGLFDHKAVFVDHAGLNQNPSLRDLVGVTQQAVWNPAEQSAEGEICLYDTPLARTMTSLLDELLARPAEAPDVGLSIVFYPQWRLFDVSPPGAESPARLPHEITAIQAVESIDLVFQPAADGRILQALSAQPFEMNSLQDKGVSATMNTNQSIIAPPPATENTVEAQSNLQCSDAGAAQLESLALTEVSKRDNPEAAGWLDTLKRSASQQALAASGLPQPAVERLSMQGYSSPNQLEQAIQAERDYLASLYQEHVIQIGSTAPRATQASGGQSWSMRSSLDRVQLALDALLSGSRPPVGIPPLSGVRELYFLLSGDYELSGVFQGERVQFANVTSSTMASMVANALNKVVVSEFAQYPAWWLPIASEMDFPSLQSVRWNILGGIGELPTVSEGAAYTELSWDDKYETASFVKKGGYLGITIESIDKDDTGRLQAAPRALAQAAWLTLSKALSSIFTSGSGAGPTLVDGTALFHTDRGNLGSSALSVTSYAAARAAMRKFTELNSGERLGALTAPKFLLVPPDLEITALQILASDYDYSYALSNGTAAPVNPLTEGDSFQARMNFARQRVIVIDLWTDTNNWAASADLRLYPTIGIGYRYGRAPEVFSVASPTAGLMFTNDTLPVKVRFFFAAGPMDWRGLYKANVA